MAIHTDMTANEKKAVAAIDRANRRIDKMEQKLRGVATAGRKAGKETEEGVKKSTEATDSGAKSVALYAAGFAAVTLAARSATVAIQEMDQARAEAAERMRASEMGLGSLGQLALGDPQREAELIRQAKEMYKGGGGPDLDTVARTLFSITSAGLNTEENRRLFTGLYGPIQDIPTLARGAATISTAMGAEETGGVRQILSKGAAASAYAPATIPELLEATAMPAAAGGMLKWSDEEVLAATTVMSKTLGESRRGGTAIRSLATSLLREAGFQDLTLPDAIKKIGGMGLTDEQLVGFLGEDATAALGGVLPRAKVGKERPFRDLRYGEAIDKLGGLDMSEAEMVKFLGPAAGPLQERLGELGTFKGLSLEESLDKVQALGLNEPQLIEFLRRKEALTAYQGLQANRELYGQILGDVRGADTGEMIEQIVGSARQQPELRAPRAARIGEAGQAIAEQVIAAERLMADAAMKQYFGEERAAGRMSEFGVALAKLFIRAEQMILGDQATIERFGTAEQKMEFYGVRRGLEEDMLYAPHLPRGAPGAFYPYGQPNLPSGYAPVELGDRSLNMLKQAAVKMLEELRNNTTAVEKAGPSKFGRVPYSGPAPRQVTRPAQPRTDRD